MAELEPGVNGSQLSLAFRSLGNYHELSDEESRSLVLP